MFSHRKSSYAQTRDNTKSIKEVVILTDALSVLQALHKPRTEQSDLSYFSCMLVKEFNTTVDPISLWTNWKRNIRQTRSCVILEIFVVKITLFMKYLIK